MSLNDEGNGYSTKGRWRILFPTSDFAGKKHYNCTYYATEQDTAPRIAMTEAFIEKVIGLKKARQSCRAFFLAFLFLIEKGIIDKNGW